VYTKYTKKNISVPVEILVQNGIPSPQFRFFQPGPEFPDAIPVPAIYNWLIRTGIRFQVLFWPEIPVPVVAYLLEVQHSSFT
jgi:hypothetical protein